MPSRSASPAAPPAENTQEKTTENDSVDSKQQDENIHATQEVVNDEDNASEEDEDGSGSEPEVPAASTSAQASTSASTIPTSAMTSGDWQAIWSPSHNAYYFFNAKTQETTWTNPLQPTEASAQASSNKDTPPEPSTSKSGVPQASVAPHLASLYAAQEAAAAQGIDPALAFLDPTLASIGGPAAAVAGGYGATAKFNARTGAFTKVDGRDPTHLSEYERAKRMSQAYFDVGTWEQDVAKRKAEEAAEEAEGGRKKKKPTKADLERFKEQKKQKKIAKTAWLRN